MGGNGDIRGQGRPGTGTAGPVGENGRGKGPWAGTALDGDGPGRGRPGLLVGTAGARDEDGRRGRAWAEAAQNRGEMWVCRPWCSHWPLARTGADGVRHGISRPWEGWPWT